MADEEDPLSAAVAGRGGLYNLSTATQPGQGALDVNQSRPTSDIMDRREYLISQLPNVRGRQARTIGTELHAIDSSIRLAQRDQAMAESQRRWEATQGRLMAHDQAEVAAQGLKLDRSRSIDEQGANLMTGLGRLDAMHRRGLVSDDEYDQHLLDLGQQNQLGLHHPVAARMYDHFITESDKRNAFNVRRLTSESAKIAARYGVEPQIDPDTGLPSLELTKAAGLTTDKGRAELFKSMNDEMLQKYGVPTGVGSLFNPIEPHTSDDKNKTINVPFLDHQGEVKKMKVPMGLFNQMKADFQDRYNIATNVPPAVAAPSPGPPTQQPAGGLSNQGYTELNLGPSGSMRVSGQDNFAKQQEGGLAPGTQRVVGGRNYSWNGTRWEPQ